MSHYRGLGIVYKDQLYVAAVRYDLLREIVPEHMRGQVMGRKRQVRGSLVLLDGALPLNETLILHMEDNREISFEARTSPNFGTYSTRFLAVAEDDLEG